MAQAVSGSTMVDVHLHKPPTGRPTPTAAAQVGGPAPWGQIRRWSRSCARSGWWSCGRTATSRAAGCMWMSACGWRGGQGRWRAALQSFAWGSQPGRSGCLKS
eukprot:366343-Chlamydomonas_euryale.AAC.5